ncbi:MAG: 1-acyl-sn-glycerol-3-phosphate acyltransferase [Oscillospiraceae bacterium]|nr:1-acyl-sn-glycerol-3-phosphate acyltransferase [Oscillospiraceae bacterium]
MFVFSLFLFLSLVAACLLNLLAALPLWAALLCGLGVFVLLHVLWMLLVLLSVRGVSMDQPIRKQNRFCRVCVGPFSDLLLFYSRVSPVITGREKLPTDGRFLFVSNHRSASDPLTVMGRLSDYNICFISKPSNLRIPIVGRGAYSIGFLPIDRENSRNALRTILTAADYLKNNLCSMAIYPEGTRSRTGELLPFHAGSLKIAQRAQVPIVVAAVYQGEKFSPLAFRKVFLDILDVIPAETVCSLRTDELSGQIRDMIRADLDRVKG